jgi:hypothetical protein
MADFKLDRIKFRWKGNWSSGVNYIKDDVVYQDGKAYVCLQGHTSTTFLNDNYTFSSVTYTVTVSTDTIDGNSQGKFYVNGSQNPELFLVKGKTYIFNLNAASNASNPLLLSITADGDLNGGARYSEGVDYYINGVEVSESNYISNFSTATTRELRFTPPTTAPHNVFYYSANNREMGNELQTRYDSNWEVMFDGDAWRNNWASGQLYTEGSIVKFNGYLYKAVTAHTSTTSLTTDISNWTLFASTFNWLNEWQTSTVYVLGDVIRYNGITYIANQSHTSAATTALGLEADQAKWTVVSVSDSWRTSWTTNTRYRVNDVVRYGAISYRCITGHTSSATEALGLEVDQAKWEIVNSDIEYRGDWTNTTRYRVNDIVKYGASLWKANQGHTSVDGSSSFRNDQSKWNLWIPGLYYELIHNSATEYSQGNVVLYGGYSYVALRNNQNKIPGIDDQDWQLITTGYNFENDWNSSTSYKTGDVVRSGGNLYVCLSSNVNNIPSEYAALWEKIVDGKKYRAEWQDNAQYYEGDLVIYKGTLYVCINPHLATESDSRPDVDILQTDQDYWQVLIQTTENNVLAAVGDIKVYQTEETRLPIGAAGEVVKVLSNNAVYSGYEEISNVFYVSTDGIDTPTAGRTISAPFRTVKYACNYVLNNVNTTLNNATIFIKTGFYQEQLPIRVPVNTALVGDELRSTTITPASGYETSNMFYVRNGSGIRNMTLQGLTGTLGSPNIYLTRRPSAGAYVSLDPGTGPADTTVWIASKSPYIQNVTTFGTGCIGLKVDGSLHNGGNRSIVANDFTQVLSDGIGYWATNQGRSELVSVFTYYCHIGYLAENGGILRATNGNNSYGTYGSVAEGFDASETPVTGTVNNRLQEAQFSEAITFGTAEQKILAIGYSHAGQDYSSASVSFNGSGTGAVGSFKEFRNGAISNIRMLDPGDSSTPGGLNYTFVLNNAQGGDQTQIQLSQADIQSPADYLGQRIVIVSGLGVGQYAEITGYNSSTKIAIVSKESDGSNGWDHFQPGWPIESLLDSTTRYSIEPRVTVEEPTFSNTAITGYNRNYEFIVYGEGKFVAVTGGSGTYSSQYATYSTNGTTWATEANLGANYDIVGLTYTGERFLAIRGSNSGSPHTTILHSLNGETWASFSLPLNSIFLNISSDGNGNVAVLTNNNEVIYSSNHGVSWSTSSITGTTQDFSLLQYGNNKLVAIGVGGVGDVAYSTNNGINWTISASAIPQNNYNDITYGNGRFVAIVDTEDSTQNSVVYSFDGITWFESSITSPDVYTRVNYAQGVFIATGIGNTVAKSQDGSVWKIIDNDSTQYLLRETGNWTDSAFGDEKWVIVRNDSSNWNIVNTGAKPILRAKISNSAVSQIVVYDPGSNLPANPVVQIVDNNNTIEAVFETYVNDGVLAQPEMSNRGTGYFTATATITGNGFAEIYQTGKFLKVSNLGAIPEPGDNLNISGIGDVLYSVVKLINIVGPHPYTVTLQITPNIGVAESPDQGTAITLRKQFSQIRLTGHDFLDIGTGNAQSTRYPELYTEGETSENARQPFNEALGFGGGRVFFTSTDQDGNFKVGSLFKVEQSTGIVTVDASQFDLAGLTELSLGGIQVGTTPVVIREFSVDSNFTANSNNIVPTQKAIAKYIENRITGGGSDITTNTLISGQVRITGTTIDTTSGLEIDVPVVLNVKQGFEGKLLALQYFARSSK